MPSFRPPCIHETHFRHRGAPFSGSLRPSATVAVWQPGPAAPVRGRASIPPGVVSTGSGAAVRRDLPGSASAYVHPCPENRASPKVSARSRGVNRPLHPSFTSFGRGSAMSAVYAFACHRPSIHHRRSGSRLCCSQIQQTAKRSSHRTRSVGQRSLPLRRHQLYRQSPRRRIRENPVMSCSRWRVDTPLTLRLR